MATYTEKDRVLAFAKTLNQYEQQKNAAIEKAKASESLAIAAKEEANRQMEKKDLEFKETLQQKIDEGVREALLENEKAAGA